MNARDLAAVSRTGEITELGAMEIARLIAAGEISSLEAVEAHIARIEAVNPRINALVCPRFDAAREEARAADRQRASARSGECLPALLGVPVTIKESLDVAALPSTFGLPARAARRAQQDEAHVARLRAAGAVVLGKTNVAQMLAFVETDNPVYGRTNNPWDLTRSPGGSSGGEAALIAARASALGLGTDIGGSLRVPAAACGIASIKPTSGRCPDLGRYSFPIGQQAIPSQVGVLARHSEDLEAGLAIIHGGRQPADRPPLPRSDAVDMRKLRVAFHDDDGTLRPSPAVRRAVREAARALQDAGAQVVEWTPPDVRAAEQAFFAILGGDGLAALKRMTRGVKVHPGIGLFMALAGLPRPLLRAIAGAAGAAGQRHTARVLRCFGGMTTADFWQSVEAQMDYRAAFGLALDHTAIGACDLVLCPAFALPALPHGATKDLGLAGCYTSLYNVLGWPAGVVPVTRVAPGEESDRPASRDIVERAAARAEHGSAGLPIGVQVVGRAWREDQVFAAMAALERAFPAPAPAP